MSYVTLDRYGDIATMRYNNNIRDPGRACGCGSWWPDYGSATRDFCYQPGIHPTNTVFNNCVERQVAQNGQLANQPDSTTPRMQNHPQQFRHPNPTVEGIFRSEIMPSRAGRVPKKDGVRQISVTRQEHANMLEDRQQTLGPTHSAVPRSLSEASLVSPSRTFNALGSTGKTISQTMMTTPKTFGVGPTLPRWVAPSTVNSRPHDAAGHAGSNNPWYRGDCRSQADLHKEASVRASMIKQSAATLPVQDVRFGCL
eukprot:gnl/TRDRNA2_/TRDRNA2_82039_c1_seq1.p1 gnl/TRDRNA2_/TRDRNA2_82039_c1~~gnl/TRDRNA2_/TRDRNA2_82039_c1_seq1.p1  ORF type:complete len:273 (+),score=21.41 gnl/TRDRNA2_/TRDRNA2_82039_c1_seq1:56-820(+)